MIKRSAAPVILCKLLVQSENIGPNFDQLKPTIPQIIYAVTNGIGVMSSLGKAF